MLGGMVAPMQQMTQEPQDSAHKVMHGLSQLINDLTGSDQGLYWILGLATLGAFVVVPKLIKKIPWFK